MKTQTLLFCLAIFLLSCEAHIDVQPGSGGLFCDCTDVSFRWEATDQNGEPLDHVTILTPDGEITRGASGTYTEHLCQSHIYVIKSKNGSTESSPWKLKFEKISGERTFRLGYDCGSYIPIITDEPVYPVHGRDILHVTRICNSYRHRSITVARDGWSFDIPAGGCVQTGDQCNVVDMGRSQSWHITPGPIIAPGITREACNLSGDVTPLPGVIDPGPLYLDVTVVCTCP